MFFLLPLSMSRFVSVFLSLLHVSSLSLLLFLLVFSRMSVSNSVFSLFCSLLVVVYLSPSFVFLSPSLPTLFFHQSLSHPIFSHSCAFRFPPVQSLQRELQSLRALGPSGVVVAAPDSVLATRAQVQRQWLPGSETYTSNVCRQTVERISYLFSR